MTRRFVLVDRDGTINQERHHLASPDDLALVPGSAAAIARLRDELGLGIVVVSNQAEVGRGNLAPATLAAINARLVHLLRIHGARVDGIFVCPHAPEEGCRCRKPSPGLAEQAIERFGFDPTDAVVIGDHVGDMGLGRAIGAMTILVRTGHGVEEEPAARPLADHVAADLAEAVAIIGHTTRRSDDGGRSPSP